MKELCSENTLNKEIDEVTKRQKDLHAHGLTIQRTKTHGQIYMKAQKTSDSQNNLEQ